MAKPLGPKSQIIRQAITDNPGMGNKEISELLMDSNERLDDKIKVTPQDVAQQKQQMKKSGEAAPKQKRGRPKGTPAATVEPQAAPRPTAQASPVDLIDKTLDLAKQCGGVEQLKRLVDKIAEMGR